MRLTVATASEPPAVTLTWEPSTGGDIITGIVEWDENPCFPAPDVKDVGVTDTATLTESDGLVPDTLYHFRVAAVDEACNNAMSNSLSATPTLCDLDGDTVPDDQDNCWEVSNPGQGDSDEGCPAPPYTSDPMCGDACQPMPTCLEPSPEVGWIRLAVSADDCPRIGVSRSR